MTTIDVSIPDAAAASQSLLSDLPPVKLDRETILRDLLGTDYEYAHDTGLIDAFYVNPETREDGLLHVLGGDVIHGPDGAKLAIGFHHEPSAPHSNTYVDREHLVGANKDHRKAYREHPFEPYSARVVIDGLAKHVVKRNEAGDVEIKPSKSNMFPKEYDPLTVMSAIVQARDSRDPSLDVLDAGRGVIVADGTAPLLDGQTPMKIRLHLDPLTGKIRSAFPKETKQGGLMSLSRDQIQSHLGL